MNVIPRSDYLPPPVKEPAVANKQISRGMVLHYPGWPQPHRQPTDTEAADIIRGWYQYHTRSRGWRDLGYSFVVAPSGTLFVGRGWGRVPGAHAVRSRSEAAKFAGTAAFPGMTNDETYQDQRRANWIWPVAVNVMVGSADPMTAEQIETVRHLRRMCVLKGFGAQLWGHQELASTSCPGVAVMNWIRGERGDDGSVTVHPMPIPPPVILPISSRHHLWGQHSFDTRRIQQVVGRVTVDGVLGPQTATRIQTVQDALAEWASIPSDR